MKLISSPQEPSPSGSGLDLGTLGLLSDRLSPKFRKALVAYGVGAAAWRVAKTRIDALRAEMTYSVAVSSDDALYPALHAWLLEAMAPENRRALTVRSGPSGGSVPDSGPGSGRARRSLALYYDAGRVQKVRLGGHQVSVALDRAEMDMSMLRNESGRWQVTDRLVLTAQSVAGRDAVLDLLEDLHRDSAKHPPTFRMADRWGQWHYLSEVPVRPLTTVVLPRGERDRIVADLETFLASEADCARLGVPWHRGYLLKGPPGTGKTSLAKAIAGHLGLDVYYMSLSTLDDDGRMAEAFGEIRARSILMLEDIDVVHGARQRDDTAKGVTLAGLLNALDGFLSPHGLITIMTSNNPGVLDPALVRPGRVDYTLELGPLDQDQLEALVDTFCGPDQGCPPLPNLRGTLMAADVVGAMKDHIGDPFAARRAVRVLLRA